MRRHRGVRRKRHVVPVVIASTVAAVVASPQPAEAVGSTTGEFAIITGHNDQMVPNRQAAVIRDRILNSVPVQAVRLIRKPKPKPVIVLQRPAVATTPVASSYAPSEPPSTGPLGARLVYLASTQAGKPYVYGGSGPYDFDCSGLVQYLYGLLGRTVPRTAEEQYEFAAKVNQGDAQVGDLIFFGTPGDIYHVGIYAGNGMMWDAPHSGTVVQLQAIWSSDYYVGRVA